MRRLRNGLLDIGDVARRLEVSERTVYRLLELGILEPSAGRRRGQKLLFSPEAVDFLLEIRDEGHSFRQLEPSQAARLSAAVLSSCDKASRLIRDAQDLVLDSLDVIYRATKHDDVYRLLKTYGRSPRHE
jgi:DNA-binding transcriptional MerR regulator